jgi:hypothetical protein
MVVRNTRGNKLDASRNAQGNPRAVEPEADSAESVTLALASAEEPATAGASELDCDSSEGTPIARRSRTLKVDKLPKTERVRGTFDSTEEIEFRVTHLAKRLKCDKADLTRVLLVRGLEGFKSDERARRAFQLLHREDAEAA